METKKPNPEVVKLLATLLALAESGAIQSIAVAAGGPLVDAFDQTSAFSGDPGELAAIRVQLATLSYSVDKALYEAVSAFNEATKKADVPLEPPPTPQ